MRFNPTIDAIIQSGKLFGDQRYNGKVTIDPEWSMAETAPVYGTAYRGPYRYWQDATNPRDEWVLPNVVSIEIDRSLSQDIATCTIRMLNQWHTDNLEEPELVNQLGQPGYFWPDRGVSEDSGTLWNHTPSEGAYRRDGTWDAGFSWTNAIVPDVILRTWEGYGGHDLSVDEAIEAGNIQITGVWLVDTISAGTDGMLELTCRDVGRLLLDQIVYPPVIPPALYPLEYYPPGKSAFDSIWSPAAHSGVSPASFGEVPAVYSSSYTDEVFGQANYAIGGTHRGSHMLDGNVKTFAWSPAEAQATSATTKAWWEVTFHRPEALDLVSLQPWAGGYTAFICVFAGGEWKGSALVPGESIRYVKQVQIPLAIPNGLEHEMRIEFDRIEAATRVRVYLLNNWYYSGIPDNEGNMYRCGIRTFRAIRKNDIAKQFSPEWNELPWTFALDQHPTRGYWVAESTGWIHGFGDAADYDSNSFGTVDVLYWSEYNKVVGIAAHPSGMGYWVLDRLGHIYAHGEAAHMGEVALPWVEGMHGWNEVQAIDIAATHTGNGYWVLYTNGVVYGFGDAWPTYWEVPPTNLSIRMMSTDYRLPYLKPADNEFGFTLEYSYRYWDASRKGMAIAAHPHAMGFWVTDGAGQVFNAGAAQYFGQFHERVYNDGASNSFRLERDEFPTAIEVTETGNGYWICNGSGRIASFGDANPKGITYVYPGETPKIDWVPRTLQSPMTYDYGSMDWSFFRALVWGLARDPDGSGFWVLTADGNVRAYDAEWWGQPGYFGLTGFRWHQGNYCVDETTEAFTRSGWKQYHEITLEDEVLGINPHTGLAEWQEITDIFIKKVHTKMYSTESMAFSALTTPNHKWLVKKSHSTGDGWRWTTSDKLNTNDRIPAIPPLSDHVFPTEKVYSDDFVRLAAFYWTEGCVDDSGRGRPRISLSQSKAKNPEAWQRIYDSLQRLYGPPGNMKVTDANWSMHLVNSGTTSFRLRTSIGEALTRVILGKNKVISQDFIFSLTKEQIQLFVEESIIGDGNIHKGSDSIVIDQADPERLKSFESACILAGYGVSVQPSSGALTLVRWPFRNPVAAASKDKGAVHELVDYEGVIWCPTTTHHNWLARRNGTTYITGNSDRSDIVKDLLAWGGWTWTADGAGILASGEELQPGESLYSANFYHLKMQTDGNLVLRDPQGHVVWHTGTFTHPGAFARMQTDGNLVIYDGEDDIFDTGTYSYPGAYLRVQTDGNLSIVDTGGTARWNSETWVKEQNNLRPLVYGNIESTGINAEIDIRGDIFDKKTLLDAITQIKESVGYNFYIDYAGAANFKSPNWWRAGNFDDETGGRLYTKVVGDEVVRTTEDDEDGAPHIPVVHEAVDMFNYSVTLSSVAQRSEIIIGSDTPDPRDPTKTGFVRYTPPDAVAEIRPGVPALRNVHKPAMWINTHFEQPEEQQLMAELIALQIWFARRTGSVTCIANPNIDIDDQVRLIERNTSETYIHYVRGKKTSGDLQSGMYSMTLTTNWLGNEDDWVITSSNTYTPLRQFQISELVDKWQLNTSRGVAFSGLGKGFVTFEGGFDAIS